jgi:hypothetical protein
MAPTQSLESEAAALQRIASKPLKRIVKFCQNCAAHDRLGSFEEWIAEFIKEIAEFQNATMDLLRSLRSMASLLPPDDINVIHLRHIFEAISQVMETIGQLILHWNSDPKLRADVKSVFSPPDGHGIILRDRCCWFLDFPSV